MRRHLLLPQIGDGAGPGTAPLLPPKADVVLAGAGEGLKDVEAAAELDAPAGVGGDLAVVTCGIELDFQLDAAFGNSIFDLGEPDQLSFLPVGTIGIHIGHHHDRDGLFDRLATDDLDQKFVQVAELVGCADVRVLDLDDLGAP